MDVKQLWIIARKEIGIDHDTWQPPPYLDHLETVRVNGGLALPLFTSREKAEQYIQNEKCLMVKAVQPADSVAGMAGFLQGMIEFHNLKHLVIDPSEAKTTAGIIPAKKLLESIIAELDKHAP